MKLQKHANNGNGAEENRKRRSLGAPVLLVILLLVGTFIWGFKIGRGKEDAPQIEVDEMVFVDDVPMTRISLEEVEAEIKKIEELATVVYLYTDAGRFEDSAKIKDFIVPLTTKSFIAKWDGTIKAGIVLDKIGIDIQDATNTIVIYLPKAEILSHEIDNNSFQTLDEKDNIFNGIKVDDVNTLLGESKKYMESKAIRAGMLNMARENAEEIIVNALNANSIIRENYTIVIEMAQ